MEDFEFSDDFCRFLQDLIPSLDAAELLLLYRASPEAGMTVEEAIANLDREADEGIAMRCLERFAARGLLARDGPRYRYGSQSPLARQADKLAVAYVSRPVTLVRIIYAFRDSRIKSFAEAFKLRRR